MLPLLLTWIFTTLGAFALLIFLGYTVQPFLYEQLADRIPLRAAIGAILLGCFYTFWVYANTRADSKDKYGVLQEFSPTARSEISEFTAIRQYPRTKNPDGTPREERIAFHKSGAGRNATFVDGKGERFRVNTSDYLTIAVEIASATGTATRFEAKLDGKGNYDLPSGRTPRFTETGARRFIEADNPGLMFAPSTAALIGAVLLNLTSYIIWVVAFWPCLRFTLGHSIAGAIGFGVLMMLLLVPLLFDKNQVTPRTADVPAVAVTT